MGRKRTIVSGSVAVIVVFAAALGYHLVEGDVLPAGAPSPEPAELAPAGAPTEPAPTPETVKVASWNILNLGRETPVEQRAEIIAQFDIVALQEVESLEGLERLRAQVEAEAGTPWEMAVSEKVGEGNAAEYYAFVYRTDRVQEVDGPKGVYPEPSPADFSREPFFATFKAGDFDFTVATIHVTFGKASERTAEVTRLADVWEHIQGLDQAENDILLMGDFNRNKPTHSAFDALEDLGVSNLVVGTNVFTAYSTKPDKIGSNWYDNIWMDPQYTGHEYAGHNGVEYIHERYYQDADHPHLEVRKKVSDHCPVWAEFHTTKGDDD